MPKRVPELTALQLKNLKNGIHNVGVDFSHYFRWLFANFRERFLSS